MDLSNPSLQHISTRNSISNYSYIKGLLGEEAALKLFDGILLLPGKAVEPALQRTYLGKPLDLAFFLTPDYWYCNAINLRIFANAAALGVDLQQMGRYTVQQSLGHRQQEVLSLVHLLGIEKIFHSAQKVNALYNKTKDIALTELSDNGVLVTLNYRPDMAHNRYVTEYNIGCYRGVLEYLGYNKVDIQVTLDEAASACQGQTILQFRWQPMRLWHKLQFMLGRVICKALFARYVGSSQCLQRYHQPLLEDYHYHVQRKNALVQELEQHYQAQLNTKQQEINRLSSVVAQQQQAISVWLDEFKQKADDWLANNACKPGASATDFASAFFMSERNLNRKLAEAYGMPAKQLIIHTRLDKARQLILAGQSVQSAAEQSGFSSVSYFSSAFKKQFGVPPSSVG